MIQEFVAGWFLCLVTLGIAVQAYKYLTANEEWAAKEIIRHEGHEAERYIELCRQVDVGQSLVNMLRQEQGGMRTEMSKRFKELEQQIDAMEERMRDADD